MIFEKKVIERKMCVLISSANFDWNISHSKKNWARYDEKYILVFHVKYRLFLSDFNETWIFCTQFRKKYSSIKFRENPASGTEDVACGRTDMTKIIVAFYNLVNEPKMAPLSKCPFVQRGGHRKHNCPAALDVLLRPPAVLRGVLCYLMTFLIADVI